MSRLADLIEELCPDGVEYKPLGEVAELKRGQSITKKSITPGDIPVIAGGRKPAYFTSSANRTGMTIVVAGSGAYAGFVSYWDQPIFVSDAFSVKVNEEILVPRFTYHWVCGKQKELYSLKSGGGVPHVYPKDVAKFKCPIPPLEVQCEIVRILDQFTTLEAELEAELEARRAQYEYYRNQLLSYDALVSRCPNGVQYKSIGSFSKCVAGATPNSKNPSLWDGDIPWMSSGEVNKKTVYSTNRFITQLGFDSCSTKMVPAGAVVIALAGQGKTRGTVARIRIELCTNQSLCAIITDKTVDSDYLFHYLSGQYDNLRAVSSGDGTRGGLNLKMIRAYKVPVPPIEEQRRIADVLDRFDTLVNDISSGLPAEIAARRAQYEYYRDRLLSFPEKK
jgi:hypothetical protein